MIGHGPKKAVSILLPMKLYEQIKTLSLEANASHAEQHGGKQEGNDE